MSIFPFPGVRRVLWRIYIGPPTSIKYSHRTANVISKHSKVDNVSKNMA